MMAGAGGRLRGGLSPFNFEVGPGLPRSRCSVGLMNAVMAYVMDVHAMGVILRRTTKRSKPS
ncbi:hypothetical protein AGR7A_pAt20310 [Agrobacterium deltaense NCPPB 1641]|uniref:Uncharacterized protein n=1 Tax=Agrobacterium deltaense NCPPB 1641 TaxID=1183425 RepID=A0A1S7U9N3_9HYPH|nr:hypothetical protein AGR7A_pAt20310 [Agrobacterium deltaense NCPPB 1641]